MNTPFSLRTKAYLAAFFSGLLLSSLLVISTAQMQSLETTARHLYNTNTDLKAYVQLTAEIEKLKGFVQRYQLTLSPILNDEIGALNEKIDAIIEKPVTQTSDELQEHIILLKTHLQTFRDHFEKLKRELMIQQQLQATLLENSERLENFLLKNDEERSSLIALQSIEIDLFRYQAHLDSTYAQKVRKALSTLSNALEQNSRFDQQQQTWFIRFKDSSLRAIQHQSALMMLSDVVMPGESSEIIYHAYQVQNLANLQIEQINDDIAQLTNKTTQVIFITGIIFVLGLFITAWLIIRMVTQPVVKLTQVFEQIISGDKKPILLKSVAEDEIGRLTSAAITFSEWGVELRDLAREQKTLLSLFDKGDAVLFKWRNDAEWSIASVSSNVEALLGYSVEQLLEQKIVYRDLIHPKDLEEVNLELSSALEADEDYFRHEPYRIITADGQEKWILDYTVTQKDENGRVTHFIGYLSDFTKQKNYEFSLRMQALKLQLASKSAEMGVWTWDLIENTLEWNDNMYKIYGLERGEADNHYSMWSNALLDEDRPRSEARINQAVAEDGLFDDIFRIRRPDGSIRYIKASGMCEIDDEGRKVAMVGTNIDVTQAETFKQSLFEAKEEAEQANRAKSDFLANMSHEIRTPLNGVIGLTDLTLKTELNEQQRLYLEQSMSSSKSLLNVINDILDYSKIEAGKLELESIPFLLENSVRNSVFLFSKQAEEKGIEMHVNMDSRLMTTLKGDPLRLQQILNNLIANAIKFTERGDITVKIELISQDEQHLSLQFCVSDTGIGIDEKKMASLFDAFTQSDTSDSRRYGGTGLGLSICKHLTELMNGEIWAKSIKGEGSSFCFSVMFEKSEIQLAESLKIENIRNKRFLVVDDNEIELKLLCDIFDSWKVDYKACQSGKDGLQAALAEHFDYIILDWKMPDVDGLRVIHQLHQQKPTDQVNIIMVTAYMKEELIKNAQAIGETIPVILEKPVLASNLFQALGVYELPIDLRALQEQSQWTFDADILVAEDNAVNQLVIKDYLTSFGCRVTLAENGKKAVEALQNNHFDLIMMDIQMPVMDGYQATQIIRESNANIAIIALSAAVMERDKKASHMAGMNEHIGKPIDPEELLSVMQKYLDAEKVTVESKSMPFELPAIEKINIAALAKAFSSKGAIRQMFTSFIKGFGDVKERFDDALPVEILQKHIHALNGASGNLFMEDLFQLVKAMNESKDEVFIREHLAKLRLELEAVLHSIRRYLESEEKPSEMKMTMEEASDLLDGLVQMLGLGRYVPAGELERYHSAITLLSDTEVANHIVELIAELEYQEAEQQLKDLRSKKA
ncbi:hypothetical protein THMIRHAS_04030 [Thiosulfatimonas sediminis]|uniref:Sensory/regulatory protein RpfC n=1 Tax=Thiosulfatimonas sediminis TaxID=2675054 RepID=A0A6F8PSR7_9GAMM|nr:response regulator [Thiosulfatimonas sediminis]BBP45030.1 hypothetical protein THMIRHAS_04030 [Thiosulfatimonas sediminis]